MSVQNDETGLVDGIVYLTPESDETRTFDVTGLLVAGGAPTLPIGVLRQVVAGVDTVVPLQDQPAVASGTTITQRFRGLTAGEYRLRLSVLSSGNRRAGTVSIVVVE